MASVLHIFNSDSWGGAEIYALELAKRQAIAGIRVGFWGLKESKIHHEIREFNSKTKLQIHWIAESYPRKWSFSSRKKILTTATANGFQILHLHLVKNSYPLAGIKKALRCSPDEPTAILHVHMWQKHPRKDPVHRFLFSGIDKVVGAGPLARENILKSLPYRNAQIVEVSYAVEEPMTESKILNGANNIAKQSEDLKILSDWKAARKKVFGYFARVDRQKGLKEFLEASSGLLKESPDFCVVIVGDPTRNEQEALDYENECRLLFDPLKEQFEDRLIWTAATPNFMALLEQVDVLVAPSYHESYALIFLHAFSFGIPAISTNSGGTPDLVMPLKTGWLIEPRSSKALSHQIKNLLTSPNEIAALKQSCLKIYHERHRWQSVLAKWNSLYTNSSQINKGFVNRSNSNNV
ncbi:MAG: hypothetical protein COT74_13705 [Bdellovibrionales bacterium CG10_big_fil_rev_8_21_14_0_10_45_34]|nr:MAG: hypothetical protein COT74_13705 [Bdellovibrionales bacterium CG10_big_fil_rev_8_21_14_0_10_45_34]